MSVLSVGPPSPPPVGAFSTPLHSHHLASRKELFPPSIAADPLYPPVDEPNRETIFFKNM